MVLSGEIGLLRLVRSKLFFVHPLLFCDPTRQNSFTEKPQNIQLQYSSILIVDVCMFGLALLETDD